VQPFGGPVGGGTLVTIHGRNFNLLRRAKNAQQLSKTPPPLCNFGNASADAAPLGGPARSLLPGSGPGLLPWHVAATIVDNTKVVCVAPPVSTMVGAAQIKAAPLELSINGQLAELTSGGLSFRYYGVEVLNVSSIYPVAGVKQGGSVVTLYGSGFDTLGLPGAGMKCLFGAASPVEAAVLHAIGSTAAAEAMGLQPGEPAADLAAVITCVAPPCVADGMLCDSPKHVCVGVTLNGDPTQNSSSCVRFTYFDS